MFYYSLICFLLLCFVRSILPEIVWDALDQSDGDSDEIEESDIPHMLWGMQGSAYVYCKETRLSGLNNLSASKALQGKFQTRVVFIGWLAG